jgi:hypothetical protein
MTEPAPRKPRRLALSLKMLMVLMLPVAVWLGWVTNKARRQREAVEVIKRYGGAVGYDVHADGKPTPGRQPWSPLWLRRLVGDDYFREVTVYRSAGPWGKSSSSHARVMPYLRDLTGLRILGIGQGQTSDAGLSNIRGLTNLEELYLRDAGELTDAGLANLAGMRRLKILYVAGAKITDASLAHLRGLTGLEELYVEGRSFTDGGLAHLEGLSNLKKLQLDSEALRITDDGLKHLKAMSKLEDLFLWNNKFTDRGLENFKGMHRLKVLGFSGTEISEDGVTRILEALPGLEYVGK